MPTPHHFPAFVNLHRFPALVVGGGIPAFYKIDLLVRFDACVTVVSRSVVPQIRELADQKRIDLRLKEYEEGDLEGMKLVIAGTRSRAVDERVAADANRRGLLLNVIDEPDLCDFIVPSIVQRGSLILAISTEGKSPTLSRTLRLQLEQQFGSEYETYLEYLAELREVYRHRISEEKVRAAGFRAVLASDVFRLIDEGCYDEAITLGKQILERFVAP